MIHKNFQMGGVYHDPISGITGVMIGYCTYITGCDQVLLQPKSDNHTKRPEAEWFDDTRLLRLGDEVWTLPGEAEAPEAPASVGFDRPAPKR